MIHIGIDPGLNGAVAILWEDGSATVHDSPVLTVENKRKPHAAAMALLLSAFTKVSDNVLVTLESVHSMPKQGVASSFSFGQGLGIWQGIIAAYGFALEMPSPQRWKKEMLSDMGKTKDAARYKASSLFPKLAPQLSRAKDDGRAEALLLADYGRRLRKG